MALSLRMRTAREAGKLSAARRGEWVGEGDRGFRVKDIAASVARW
jgi:hypothetical protein